MGINETLVLTSNYSSRGGVVPIKFACHTTQGWQDSPNGMYDCAHYFQGDVSASSHYINDNFHPGLVVAGVYEQYAAWTQSGANSMTISVEQCALAEWSRDYWLNNRGVLLQTTAALIRQVCDANQIPIRVLSSSEAQDSWTKGVCEHVDFGSMGGGHHDCGSGYPMDKVIEWAKAGTGAPAVGGANVATSSALDPDGSLHYACLSDSGKVMYWPPGWDNWGEVDTTQSGAISGVGITIDPLWWVTLTYTNGSGNPCEYRKKFREGDWKWRGLGTIKAR